MPSQASPFVGSDQWITLFSDASFCPMTGAYGWCFWIKHGSPARTIVKAGGGMSIEGSNQAEIEALRQGLAAVAKLDILDKRIVIQSDCIGAIEAIGDKLMELKRMGAKSAYTKHVKGHRGHSDRRASVNTLCDRKAGEQMLLYREKARLLGQVRQPKPKQPRP